MVAKEKENMGMADNENPLAMFMESNHSMVVTHITVRRSRMLEVGTEENCVAITLMRHGKK